MKLENISIKSILIIILATTVIVLLSLRSCDKDKPVIADTTHEIEYITDTLYKGKYDSLVKVKGKPIKPKTLINWLPSKPQIIDSVEIINGYLKLHPQGKPPLDIKNEFLTNYTSSPKLLSLGITRDSLSMTTYNPDATTLTKVYPLFLEKYGYDWKGDKLVSYEVSETKPLVIKKNKLSNFYINMGYDGFLKLPTAGLEYNLLPGRFKVDLDGTVLIQQEPKLNLNAKLGYRLF